MDIYLMQARPAPVDLHRTLLCRLSPYCLVMLYQEHTLNSCSGGYTWHSYKGQCKITEAQCVITVSISNVVQCIIAKRFIGLLIIKFNFVITGRLVRRKVDKRCDTFISEVLYHRT